MQTLSNILIGIVVLFQLGFLCLEMFLWEKPFGRSVFRISEESAAQVRMLTANQGFYSSFLAAGLIWVFFSGEAVKNFFLICVILAGVFGAITVGRRIFFIQALPAALARLTLLLF